LTLGRIGASGHRFVGKSEKQRGNLCRENLVIFDRADQKGENQIFAVKDLVIFDRVIW
jgi:hypothetical protein